MYAIPSGSGFFWQRILTYKEYEEIIQCKAIKNYAHLHMVQAHFSAVYNVSFLKYFFIYDKIIHKHESAISKASTPLIIYWYHKFVYFPRQGVRAPGGRGDEACLYQWCHFGERSVMESATIQWISM